MRPQSIGAEASDLRQRVVTSAMGIADEIVELLQFSEDGQVDGGSKSALELVKGGHLGVEQMLTQDVGVEQRWPHNVIVPIISISMSAL
jgi:hypothetical protein